MSRRIPSAIVSILCALSCIIDSASAQATAITYQGELTSGGAAANGQYDFNFSLYQTNSTNGTLLGGPLLETNVGVTNGLFTVLLDFGAAYSTGPTWLAIAVRANGGAAFAPLTPLQELTPAPSAIYAESVAGSNILGAISPALLPGIVVTNNALNVNFTGTFSGTGSGLSNLNVTQVDGLAPAFGSATVIATVSESAMGLGNANHVAIANNILCVANKSDGLRIIDISNPFAPVVKGNIPYTSFAYQPALGVAIKGSYAFVACSYGGLYVVDISNPSSPNVVAALGEPTSPNGSAENVIAPPGNYVYVANDQGGVWVVNASAPIHPFIYGYATGYAGSVSAFDVAVEGNVLAIGDYYGLIMYNISNPQYPIYSGSLASSALNPNSPGIYGVKLSGTNAYVATAGEGLYVVNISNPSNPTAAGHIGAYTSYGLALAGNDVYLAAASDGVPVIDCSNPGSPVVVAQAPLGAFGGEPSDVVISGAYAAVAAGGGGVSIMQIGTLLSGNGSALTNITDTNVALLNRSSQTFTGSATFNGGISSPKWNATNVINSPGPLTLTSNFVSHGGTLLVFVSGSGSTSTAASQMGMNLALDSTTLGTVGVWENTSLVHQAFIPQTFVKTGIAAGLHTIKLTAIKDTATDVNDHYFVTVQELPF